MFSPIQLLDLSLDMKFGSWVLFCVLLSFEIQLNCFPIAHFQLIQCVARLMHWIGNCPLNLSLDPNLVKWILFDYYIVANFS